jgi:hypothetical protein
MTVVTLLVLTTMAAITMDAPEVSASRYGTDTSLADVDASFYGENMDDRAGVEISGVGDLNGDGYDDIAICSPHNGYQSNGAGQLYLFFGKRSGWTRNTNVSSADASFVGEMAWDNAGRSVAGVGDVNADGYDDLIVGAYLNDEGGLNAGQLYLILGKASGWTMHQNLSTADASFWGESDRDWAGETVSGAGDVNGDGYDDFLVGAPGNADGGSSAGQTYLVLGKASGWSMDTNLSNADASYWGENANDRSSRRLAGAGDVNGDGYDDFLIGAPWNSEVGTECGQGYLILGKATGWSMDTDLSAVDASFIGEDAGDEAGRVGYAGDVNGDGYDDILIGARWDEEGGYRCGQAYLIFGRSTGWSMDTNLSTANASFWGRTSMDNFGHTVAGVGDVNNDGYDDFLLPGSINSKGPNKAGQIYLHLGRSTGWTMDTNISAANASFIGEGLVNQAGIGIAAAGDVNGDGYDDILIGASQYNHVTYNQGKTYLIFFNVNDTDDDGYHDGIDAFPDNPFEHKDTDGDGIGDNLDPDADGDNVPDERDAFPLNKSEHRDTDGDGTGDNTDADDDNDGINDTSDAFPKNPFEYADADEDGIGDNLDPDDDNDGKTDEEEMRAVVRKDLSTASDRVLTLQTVLEEDLGGMNTSLHGSLSDLETGFLDELEGLNRSLAEDIRSSVQAISDRVSALDASIGGDVNDLRTWLHQVLTSLQGELAGTNATLITQMDQIDADAGDLYEALADDLYLLMVKLARIESHLGEEAADVRGDIRALSETMADLEEHTVSELAVQLDRLAANVSAYDEDTALQVSSLAGDLRGYEARLGSDLDELASTLGDLERLSTILSELEALDGQLKDAEAQLDRSVADAGEEQKGASSVNMYLVVLVIVLLVVVLIMLLRSRPPSVLASYRSREEDDIIVSADDEGGA